MLGLTSYIILSWYVRVILLVMKEKDNHQDEQFREDRSDICSYIWKPDALRRVTNTERLYFQNSMVYYGYTL